MNKEFVPYNESLELKQLGFDGIYTFKVYDSTTKELIFNDSWYDVIHKRKNSPFWPMNRSELANVVSGYILAPLYQQAFRWLLKNHQLYGIVIPTITMDWTFKTMTVIEGIVEVPPYKHVDAYDYSTPEEAELACLRKLIELVKAKQ